MSGILDMGNKKIINIAGPNNNADAVNKAYIDNGFLILSGGLMSGIKSEYGRKQNIQSTNSHG